MQIAFCLHLAFVNSVRRTNVCVQFICWCVLVERLFVARYTRFRGLTSRQGAGSEQATVPGRCKSSSHKNQGRAPMTSLRFSFNLVVFCCAIVALGQEDPKRKNSWKCEHISVPICQNLGYNLTRMPNQIGQETQEEAKHQLQQFLPLIKFDCASQLTFFLCSSYLPMCTTKVDVHIRACRPLCEYVKKACLPVLTEFGIPWPSHLNCSLFEPINNERVMCMPGPNFTDNLTEATSSRKPSERTNARPGVQNGVDGCWNFKNSPNYYYVKSTDSCTPYCNREGIFKKSDWGTMELWMAVWSGLCFFCTFVTLSTFLIDTSRFKYPERAIIWLALCYNLYSLSYIVRLAAGREAISCDTDSNNVQFLIQDGLRNTGCAIVFLIQYFFSMAATVWWVILALMWFLAAGMKWGYEAIGSYANLFHVIAWALPCIKTIFIFITRKVDGDELTGLCFVGNQDLIALAAFVLGPQFTYLIIGTLFLIAGFVALFRIRATIQRDGSNKTDKLERLMVRIGVFSVFSTVPATAVIACHFYEYANKDYWSYGQRDSSVAEPNVGIFMLKIFMSLFTGTITGLWVCSSKTLHSWRMFSYRLLGKRPPQRPAQKNGKAANETTV